MREHDDGRAIFHFVVEAWGHIVAVRQVIWLGDQALVFELVHGRYLTES